MICHTMLRRLLCLACVLMLAAGCAPAAAEETKVVSVFINHTWFSVKEFTGIIPDAITEATGVTLDVTVAKDAQHLNRLIAQDALPDMVYTSTMIERFNDPAVRCCWDFGHARCAFGTEGMLEAMRLVGEYLCCTHVHDNYYGKDLHLTPFLGNIDWEAHMACLGEMGYQGKLSFEMVYGRIPDALMEKWLKGVYEVGEYLNGLFEAAKDLKKE